MRHRGFLKVALVLGLGIAAGSTLPMADAAPLSPAPIVHQASDSPNAGIHRAVTSREEVDRLAPEQVRWSRRWHHHHWHHRHWGWHHRHWHHRHWGWRHHHWHHRHWW